LGKRALVLALEVLAEALGVLGLEGEVELGGDGAVELIDERDSGSRSSTRGSCAR
jgi:hypothetical protein